MTQGATIALGWLIILTMPGCVLPHIMTQADYDFYNSMSISYGRGDYDDAALDPRIVANKPRTVVLPEKREQWELTLEEAKRIALWGNKQIVAFAAQPGQAGTIIDLRLSLFDAFVSVGGGWSRENVPLTSNVATVGTGQNAVTVDSFGQSSALSGFLFSSGSGFGVNTTTGAATQDRPQSIPGQNLFELVKRNATGGLTRLNYSLAYSLQDPVGGFTTINPAWTSVAEASIEQPFLQGAGVEFNRAGILVARANYEQSLRGFESVVHQLLRDVESLYWQLHYAYYDLYSREVGLQQGLSTWQRERTELDVGAGSKAEVAQAREQVEFFRAERVLAMQRLLTIERNLRNVMGLPPEDDRQIVPADEPLRAFYEPDWNTAVAESVTLRPDVLAQAMAVRAADLELFRQQNGLYPDLTGNAQFGLSGLDNQFDQSIDRLTDGDFESWILGLRYRRQIGERASHARVRGAQLTLSQEKQRLEETQHRALHELAETYRNLITNRQLIDVQEDRRQAAGEQLQAQIEFYRQGRFRIDDLLRAQSDFADAIRDEALAVAQYNQSLIQWEFSKGTILAHDNVSLADGSAPRVSRKLLEDRRKWWQASLPLPIWRGTKVHGDHFPCPDPERPFYPAIDRPAETSDPLSSR